MSKQKTRADLEREIVLLNDVINDRETKISDLETENKSLHSRFNNLIDELYNAVQPEYRVHTGAGLFGGGGSGNIDRYRSSTAVFFRIGRLIAIEQEHTEFKDRFLPLEKSKVLEAEMNQNRRV